MSPIASPTLALHERELPLPKRESIQSPATRAQLAACLIEEMLIQVFDGRRGIPFMHEWQELAELIHHQMPELKRRDGEEADASDPVSAELAMVLRVAGAHTLELPSARLALAHAIFGYLGLDDETGKSLLGGDAWGRVKGAYARYISGSSPDAPPDVDARPALGTAEADQSPPLVGKTGRRALYLVAFVALLLACATFGSTLATNYFTARIAGYGVLHRAPMLDREIPALTASADGNPSESALDPEQPHEALRPVLRPVTLEEQCARLAGPR